MNRMRFIFLLKRKWWLLQSREPDELRSCSPDQSSEPVGVPGGRKGENDFIGVP